MERRNFGEVLKDAKVDLEREYTRIYEIFEKNYNGYPSYRDICAENFYKLPFKGTCISLDDFDEYFEFDFEEYPSDFDINYLVNYCEYVFNLIKFNLGRNDFGHDSVPIDFYLHIEAVIEKIGYIGIEDEEQNVTIFVPKSQPAILVSETLPSNLSYKVIEYNHHSMEGNIERKKETLKFLSDRLEGDRDNLNSIDKQLESDLFYLFNNLNIRHNNIEPSSRKYKEALAKMGNEELEKWYDKTYELCLLAFMELENKEHKPQVMDLKRLLGEI